MKMVCMIYLVFLLS